MLAAPRRILAHRRIINLYAVLSGRPLRANLSLWPLLTALTLRASITLGANRASFANRPLRAGIALLALYTLNALLTLGGRALRCRPSRPGYPARLAAQQAPADRLGR